jgi:hypothetical protein
MLKYFLFLLLSAPFAGNGASVPSKEYDWIPALQQTTAVQPGILQQTKETPVLVKNKRTFKKRVVFWLVKQKFFHTRKSDPKKKFDDYGLISLLAGASGMAVFLLGSTGLFLFAGIGGFSLSVGLFVAALAFGIISLKKQKRRNAKAIIGIILGSLGLLSYLVLIAIVVAWISSFGIR